MAFSTSLVTAANIGQQNFFETTLKTAVSGASDTNIYLNTLPTPTEGFLVIEPTSSSAREVIFYTSQGADFVTVPSAANGRGVGGTTAQGHSQGATVRMADVAEYWKAIKDGYAITAGAITTTKIADSNVTFPKISAFDKVRVSKSAPQSIPDSVETTVTWDQEDFDTNTMHDNSTNSDRLVAKTAGKYLITATLLFLGHATDNKQRSFVIQHNGTTVIGAGLSLQSNDTIDTTVHATTIYDMAVNDYVTIKAYQDSGGALNVRYERSHFAMTLLP